MIMIRNKRAMMLNLDSRSKLSNSTLNRHHSLSAVLKLKRNAANMAIGRKNLTDNVEETNMSDITMEAIRSEVTNTIIMVKIALINNDTMMAAMANTDKSVEDRHVNIMSGRMSASINLKSTWTRTIESTTAMTQSFLWKFCSKRVDLITLKSMRLLTTGTAANRTPIQQSLESIEKSRSAKFSRLTQRQTSNIASCLVLVMKAKKHGIISLLMKDRPRLIVFKKYLSTKIFVRKEERLWEFSTLNKVS